jgi:putative membrane protein
MGVFHDPCGGGSHLSAAAGAVHYRGMTVELASWTGDRIAAARWPGWWHAGWWHAGWWGGWWWWLWWLAMVAVSLAFVAALVWLMRRQGGPGPTDVTAGARQVLAERYARGELTTEEYRARLAELDRGP